MQEGQISMESDKRKWWVSLCSLKWWVSLCLGVFVFVVFEK